MSLGSGTSILVRHSSKQKRGCLSPGQRPHGLPLGLLEAERDAKCLAAGAFFGGPAGELPCFLEWECSNSDELQWRI